MNYKVIELQIVSLRVKRLLETSMLWGLFLAGPSFFRNACLSVRLRINLRLKSCFLSFHFVAYACD